MRLRLVEISLLLLLALVAIAAYLPGLHGGFLFDDFANLPAIGATGPVDTWPTFWRFVTSGTADPTGRPLTLLTFLIDARSWPADPYPFKRTSLLLHLLNGLLLYGLLARLGGAMKLDAQRRRLAALMGSALWLLHPLLVSTTLYIVQREAMLPATCVMAGLLLWLHGRSHLASGHIRVGLFWSAAGLGGFSLLGALAKANGILLPVYALLIEVILLAPRQCLPGEKAQSAYRRFMQIFAMLPTIAIFAYLTWFAIHFLTGAPLELRPWTYAQRLLTEPRVLMQYLSLLWLPRPYSSGLFNDQYTASVSLLHPASTLPAILAVLALVAGAWRLRRGHPALALAVLFFFVGHLLESSTIPLELYFEHRNYAPALLMFWPLGLWLADPRTLRTLKQGMMIALPIGLALITHARAEVWGNPQTQALLWAQINPNSARAQANAAQMEMQMGQPQDAVRRLERLMVTQPDQVQLAFNLLGARCMTGGITDPDMIAAHRAMQGSLDTGSLFAHWFDRMLPVAISGDCPGLTPAFLLDLINTGLQNPRLAAAGPQQDLTYLRGEIALANHHPDEALADFVRALNLQVRPGMALQAAAALGSAGYPRQGLRMLDHYEQVKGASMPPEAGMPMLHAWVLLKEDYWPREIAHLRQLLEVDANNGSTNTPHTDSSSSQTK